jgi:DNA-binding NarL/FixJ family response regulator
MIGNILILEDVRQSREWLADIVLRIFPDAALTQEATLRGAERAIGRHAFDLALIDLKLPDGNGADIIRKLTQLQPECRRVVTTIMATDSAIVSALAAGAQGYLLKCDSEAIIEHHLHLMMEGQPPLSPQIARRIMSHFELTGPSFENEVKLTKRETEVLRVIARGLTVSEAARTLGSADSTVATHIKSIYRKLEITNRAEAALHASRLGLLSRD